MADREAATGTPMENGALMIGGMVPWGFVMRIFIVWLYAAIRPCVGVGPNTAGTAAATTWIPGYVLSIVSPLMSGSRCVWLGAWLYRK